MDRRQFVLFGILALGLSGGAAASKAETPPDLRTFLKENAGFSGGEIAAIEREAVVKQIPVHNNVRELALVGVVRIGVQQAFIVEQVRRIRSFLKSH